MALPQPQPLLLRLALLLLLLLLLLRASASSAFVDGEWYTLACHQDTHACSVVPGKDGPAWGFYRNEQEKDGWGKLFIACEDSTLGWWAAGFLEGALTSERIHQHYVSWYDFTFSSSPLSNETVEFMLQQYAWAQEMAHVHADQDDYWARVGQVLAQFEGIFEGTNSYAKLGQSMSKVDLLILEAAGDMYDIIPATTPVSERVRWTSLSKEQFLRRWHKSVSCSAFIKISDDLTDVFAGHTTWTSYQNMLRVWKQYEFGRHRVSFSAKPGVVYSKDDFYTLPNTKLVVMETTNGILNDVLYDLIVPTTLLTWQRIPVANSIATGGRDWTNVMNKYQSGTYANQYMVVDMKKFMTGKGAQKDFLWIVEQIPGMAPAEDVTDVLLNQGNYWPSYNVPFNKLVYEVSGFQAAYEKYGDDYSYTDCLRATMFRRDNSSIQSLGALQAEMRYNDYVDDELSEGDPYKTICPRKDLETTNAKTWGGIDSKVTSFKLMRDHGESFGQSGPTHDDQAPFSWADGWESVVHLGQPETFNFGWVEFDWGF